LPYDITEIELGMLKYDNFIKNYPDKAHGYYCMGKLHFKLSQYKAAERFFNKALSINKNLIIAKIWLILCYIYRKKLLKASNYYETIRHNLSLKHIYKIRVANMLSLLYSENIINSMLHGLFSSFYLRYSALSLENILKKDPDDYFANILMSIYFLIRLDRSARAIYVHRNTILMDGLSDNFRWILARVLFRDDPSVYKNLSIAGKFSSIPSKECPSLFVNTIFEAALKQNIKEKIQRMAVNVDLNTKTLTHINLWRYLMWCREKGIYDITVLNTCRKLLRIGWVDRFVYDTMNRLKELGIAKETKKEDSLFELYGYTAVSNFKKQSKVAEGRNTVEGN